MQPCQKTTHHLLAKLPSTNRLLGACLFGNQVYLLYPRLIQGYGPMDHPSLLTEIHLNQSIIAFSQFQNHLFLVYESGLFERRNIDEWENPVGLGPVHGVLAMEAVTQAAVIVTKAEGIELLGQPGVVGRVPVEGVTKVAAYDGVMWVLNGHHRISKYGLDGQQIGEKIISDSKLIIDFVILLGGQLLTVDSTLRLDFYQPSTLKPIRVCWPWGKNEAVVVSKTIFDKEGSRLWAQRGDELLSAKLGRTDGQGKFVRGCWTGKVEGELIAASGTVVLVKSGDNIYIEECPIEQLPKQDQGNRNRQEQKPPQTKSIEQVLKQKEQIRKQILNYSRKCLHNEDIFDIQHLPKLGFDKSTSITQAQNHFAIQTQSQQPDQDNFGLQTSPKLGIDKQTSVLVPSSSQQGITTDQPERHDKHTEVTALQTQTKETSTNLMISASKSTCTEQKSLEHKETGMDQKLSKTISTATQLKTISEIGIQTDGNFRRPIKVTEEQMQKLYLKLSTRVQQSQKKLLVDLQSRHSKLQSQLSRLSASLSQSLSPKLLKPLSKDLNQLLQANFLPKLQKYFSLTFDKVMETFQKAVKYHQQQNDKSSVRLAEMTREVVERSKGVVEKAVLGMRDAIGKIGEGVGKIDKQWDVKGQELVTVLAKVTEEGAKDNGKILDDRWSRIEEAINKIAEEVKGQDQLLDDSKLPSQILSQSQSIVAQQPPPQQYISQQPAYMVPPVAQPHQYSPLGWYPPPPLAQQYQTPQYPTPQYPPTAYPYYPPPSYPQSYPQGYPYPQPQPQIQQQPQQAQQQQQQQSSPAMAKLLQQLLKRRKKSNDNTQ